MKKKELQAQIAYNEIKKYININKLRPGTPLVEAEFAEKLNMSRTPIREAFKTLSVEGLIEIKPNKGAYIRMITKQDLLMVCEVAEALEGMLCYNIAVEYSQGKVKEKVICDLEDINTKMKEHLDKEEFDSWALCDQRFHDTIYGLCKNTFIMESLNKIYFLLNSLLWHITIGYIDKHKSIEDHINIVKALREGNGEKARSFSQMHRNRVRKEIEQIKILDII